MAFLEKLSELLPEVAGPTQKRLSFKEKLKWTIIVLVLFFILGIVPLFGLGSNALSQFEFLSIILGAEFGSLVSLGIGPIVTASIVLQLLNGSGILKFDLTSHEGRRKFQGLQKILVIAFIIFEAFIYVMMGGLSPGTHINTGSGEIFTPALADIQAGLPLEVQALGDSQVLALKFGLMFQLFLGGVLILFMDEVTSKWGFGSGVSLFIAGGVSKGLFIRALSFYTPPGADYATGAIPAIFQALAARDPLTVGLMVGAIVATIVVFCVAVYGQSMKIEIPLSFGRIRGHGIRWPLQFMYTSVIPIILVAALIANVQLFARLLQNWGYPLLGTFVGNQPASGLIVWLFPPNIVDALIKGTLSLLTIAHGLTYMLFMMSGATLFSWFWVQTSGMDAQSQAKQIMASGLQIPGFRKDQRVLERLLQRYIGPLTIMGAMAVGFLAALADVTGALTSGTGLLLAVMIIYKLYEDIARQHMMDMNPMMRKFMGGE